MITTYVPATLTPIDYSYSRKFEGECNEWADQAEAYGNALYEPEEATGQEAVALHAEAERLGKLSGCPWVPASLVPTDGLPF